MRRRPGALSTALAAVLVLPACGIGGQESPVRVATEQLPAAFAETVPASPVPLRAQVTVYLVEQGRLVPRRARAVVDSPGGAVHALLTLPAPHPGARSAVPEGTALQSVRHADLVLTVDLSPAFMTARGRDQLLAVAQVVLTATEFPGVRSVRILVAGVDVAVPTGDGELATGPVERADYATLAAD